MVKRAKKSPFFIEPSTNRYISIKGQKSMFSSINSSASKSLLNLNTTINPSVTGFEASCNENEHIIAFNLRPAKHLELNAGTVTNTSGKRNSTYLTVTAGSIMVTEKDQPFLKSKVLVSAFLYKGGRYIEPPAYTQSSAGIWELHPKAACTGLSALVYGIWLRDTKEAFTTISTKLDEIVQQYNYCQSIPSIIEGLEGCITTGDYTPYEDKGITSEEQAIESIQSLNIDFEAISKKLPELEEEHARLSSLCETLTQHLSDKTYWRQMVEKIQETINLVGLCNEDIIDSFGELKESKGGLLLKCKVKVVYDYLNTFEIKLVCLSSVIEPGNLGGAITGTVVSQKDSTELLKHTAAHLESLNKANQAADAEARMRSWVNTSTNGNKKSQALNLYHQGTQKTKETNTKKIENKAKEKEKEIKNSIEQAKAGGSLEDLKTLEATLLAVQARIAELQNQKLATAPLPEVEEVKEEEFDGNMVM